jgi:transcriptional regulator with XRE-family HTH domain
MKKLERLKGAIFADERKQRDIAKAAGVCQTYISQAINGRYVLDDEQKQKIAKALGRKVQELFD